MDNWFEESGVKRTVADYIKRVRELEERVALLEVVAAAAREIRKWAEGGDVPPFDHGLSHDGVEILTLLEALAKLDKNQTTNQEDKTCR